MREPRACAAVRRRLERHGVPARRIDRIVRELSEHWHDLEREGLDTGLSPAVATRNADARLGCPDHLAESVIHGFRARSWMGRHPLLTICLGPLVLPPLLMACVVLPIYWSAELIGYGPWADTTGNLDGHMVATSMTTLHYLALAASPLLLGWRTWHAGLGTRCIVAVFAWCTLTALLRYFNADAVERNITMGLTFPWSLNSRTTGVVLVHALAAAFFLVAVRLRRGRAISYSSGSNKQR